MESKYCPRCCQTKRIKSFCPTMRKSGEIWTRQICNTCHQRRTQENKEIGIKGNAPVLYFCEETMRELRECKICRVVQEIKAFHSRYNKKGKRMMYASCNTCRRSRPIAKRALKINSPFSFDANKEEWLKRCPKCCERKAIGDFGKQGAGRVAWCRECESVHRKLPHIKAKSVAYHARSRGGFDMQIEYFSLTDLIERDGTRCYLCQEDITDGDFTMDHLTPISRGGHHTFANVKIACRRCNSRKKNLTLSEYIEWQNSGCKRPEKESKLIIRI